LKEKEIILILLISSLLLRFYFLMGGLFHYDAIEYAMLAERLVLDGKFAYAHGTGYPIFILLVSSVFYVHHHLLGATSAEFSMLFIPALAGALSVPLIYLFGREIFNREVGLISAVLLLFSPLAMGTSQLSQTNSTSSFFILLIAYAILKTKSKDNLLFPIVVGIIFGMVVGIRTLNIVFIPASILLYLNEPAKKEFIQKVRQITVFISSALVFSFIPYSFAIMKGGLSYVTWWSGSDRIEHAYSLSYYSPLFPSYSQAFLTNFTLFGLLIIAWGLFQLYKDRHKFLIILLWAAPYTIYYTGNIFFASRYLLTPFMALTLTIGFAISKVNISSIAKNNNYMKIGLVLLIIFSTADYWSVLTYRKDNPTVKNWALWVESNTEENAVILTGDYFIHLGYYTQRKAVPIGGQEVPRYVDELIESRTPVYFTGESRVYGEENLDILVEKYVFLESIATIEKEDFHHKTLKKANRTEHLYKIVTKEEFDRLFGGA
jgi:4-amino-4-deoxy-L-arabinose transferase-like glycosyltransferase